VRAQCGEDGGVNDSCPLVEKPRQSLNIGVIAYECIPGLVFVRVPSERGRWMLTDRCVAEVDCGRCGALSGEPCFTVSCGEKRYTVGTHTARRVARHNRYKTGFPKPKLRIRDDDIRATSAEPAA